MVRERKGPYRDTPGGAGRRTSGPPVPIDRSTPRHQSQSHHEPDQDRTAALPILTIAPHSEGVESESALEVRRRLFLL